MRDDSSQTSTSSRSEISNPPAYDAHGINKPTKKPVLDHYANAEIAYLNFGPPEVLRFYGYLVRPEPKIRTDVVVEVEASTVTLSDCFVRQNIWPVWNDPVSLPNTSGMDCVGRVYKCGDLAKKYGIREGDRVGAYHPLLGGNARYVTHHAANLVKIPDDLDAVKVVCLLRNFMVAYQALYRAGGRPIKAGDRVLVTGGNGAVGQAVIQLANLAGASIVFATAERKHRKMLRILGATQLGIEPEEWLPEVSGDIDIVVDSVCADGYQSARDAVKPKSGKLVCTGTTSELWDGPGCLGMPMSSVFSMVKANYILSQTTYYDLFSNLENHPETFSEDLEYLTKLLRDGWINPKIKEVVPLLGVTEAHKKIESGGLDGCIVCVPWLGSKHYDTQLQGQMARAAMSRKALTDGTSIGTSI